MVFHKAGIGLFAALIAAFSATFHIDPKTGNMANSGSASSPWRTLQEVFDSGKIQSHIYKSKPAAMGGELIAKNEGAPVKGGDTLLLKTGFYGKLIAREYYNENYITIMAAAGETPAFEAIEMRSVSKWRLIGLTASPQFAQAYKKQTLFSISSHGHSGPSYDCIIEHCTGYSVPYASGWNVADWNSKACNGIALSGDKLIARHNSLKNVNFAYSATGDSCLLEYNSVENFSGDGIRGLGDYSTYQYNIVKNCYAVNQNHDDGFQSWSVGANGVGTGVVRGVILRGNTIINYEDPNQPHKGTLQGIGCFDGMFEDWIVENNVIMVDHWHGLSLYGAKNCTVINNTVVDLNGDNPGPPWIKVTEHKNGASPIGCVIRNNLTTKIASSSQGVTIDHNIIVNNYDDYFANYAGRDLRLKKGCGAINTGSSDNAPAFDRNRFPRSDGQIDVGAFEFGSVAPLRRPAMPGIPYPISVQLKMHDIRGRSIPINNGDASNKRLGPGLFFFRRVSPDKQDVEKRITNRKAD